MKQLFIFLLCLFMFSCDEKVSEMKSTSESGVVESLTENSIGGYSFESLLEAEGARPSSINGGEVRYFEGSNTYMPNAKIQVQIQFSKLGLNVSEELVLSQVEKFSGLKSDVEFGQHDIYWNSEKIKCYISVHTDDDIFEISCWS